MFYRENGQFKTTYRRDLQIFPIAQDRIGVLLLLAFAFLAVPFMADEYTFRAILIPFLILSLAALGLNILVGYCGQVSLGTGAFMAVGAYAAYNFLVRIEGMPLLVAIFNLVGLFGAQLIGVQLLGVDPGAFWSQMQSAVELDDVVEGIVKSLCFGVACSLIAVFEGYNAEPTAAGVGLATTRTVVISSVLTLLIDYMLTAAFLGR